MGSGMSVVRVSTSGGVVVKATRRITSVVGVNTVGYATDRLEVTGPMKVVGVTDSYGSRVEKNRRVLVNVSRAAVANQQNIVVQNLLEGAIVPHNLDSMFLAGRFFLPSGRELKHLDFECVDNGNIKVYLPMADNDLVDTFTGEILLERRR
jgi:hypothetical protein